MNSAVKSGSRLLSFNNSLSVNKVIVSLFLSLSFEFSSTSSTTSSVVSSSSSTTSTSSTTSGSSGVASSTTSTSSGATSSIVSASSTISSDESSTISMSFLKVKSFSLSSTSGTIVSSICEDVTSTSLDVFDTSLLMSDSSLSISPLNKDLRRFIIDIKNTPRIIIGQYSSNPYLIFFRRPYIKVTKFFDSVIKKITSYEKFL